MQQALALDPLSIIINSNVADHLIYLQRYDEAFELYGKIIEIDPTLSMGYAGKARIAATVYGRIDEGVDWVNKALAVDPESPQFNGLMAGMFIAMEDLDRAQCWVTRAHNFGPNSFLPNLLQSVIYAVTDREKEAILAADTALKTFPTNNDGLMIKRNLACIKMILQLQGKFMYQHIPSFWMLKN